MQVKIREKNFILFQFLKFTYLLFTFCVIITKNVLGGIFYGNGNLCYAGCNGICFSDIRIVFLDVGILRSTACWQSIGREIL